MRPARQGDRQAVDLAEAHGPLAPQRASRRRDQHDVLDHHLGRRDVLEGAVVVKQGHVEAAGLDPFVEAAGHRLDEMDGDAGVAVGDRLDQRHREAAAGGGRQAEADLAGRVLGRRAHQLPRPRQLAQDRARVLAEDEAEIGRRDAARVALEQLDAELFLERADVLAERGLGDAQRFGRLREAARLGDLDEVAELAEIHSGRAPCSITRQVEQAARLDVKCLCFMH